MYSFTMNTIPTVNFVPIVCPQRQFHDRTGTPNAYVDTNPSLYVDASGNATVLVRQVNYRKFKDRSFFVGESQSRSEYYVLYGTYTNSKFTFQEAMPVSNETNLQRYPTYWYGPEDIRFIDHETILATYPELGPGGNPRIVVGNCTEQGKLHFTQLLEGQQVEKNWMPFTYMNSPFVVYSVSPLRIRPLYVNEMITIHTLPELAGYHGSTNGIPFKSGHLFLIHKYETKTEHRWLYLQLHDRAVAYSEPFTFFEHSYIEFPCSLVELPDKKLAISLGINDCMANIAIIEPTVVELCEVVR